MIVDLEMEESRDIMVSARSLPIHDLGFYRTWLSLGYGGEMNYLSRSEAILKREDPSLILKNSKSIVTFLVNYNRILPPVGNDEGRISKYAIGPDYHRILPEIMRKVIEKNHLYKDEYRIYSDTGPILEREISRSLGLGWIGKNSMLINKEIGSFTYIGEVLTDINVRTPIIPQNDLCGKCKKCIQSCPTGAIGPDRMIDSNKCISYHTIENRGLIDPKISEKMGNMIFGCDICNDVCPWNSKIKETSVKEILSRDFSAEMDLEKTAFIEREEFEQKFRGSAIKRATYEGLARNAAIAIFNQDPSDPLLRDLVHDSDDLKSKQIKKLKNWV